MTQSFGVITSPGFPQDYRSYIDCTWNIHLSIGQFIQLKFLHFDLDPLDPVTIYDGDSDSSPSQIFSSYNHDFNYFLSSSNHLFIHFSSGFSGTASGFKLEYNATSKNPCKANYLQTL